VSVGVESLSVADLELVKCQNRLLFFRLVRQLNNSDI